MEEVENSLKTLEVHVPSTVTESSSFSADSQNAEKIVLNLLQETFREIFKQFRESWTPAAKKSLAAMCSSGTVSLRNLWEQYQVWSDVDPVVSADNSATILATLSSESRDAMLIKLYTVTMEIISVVEDNLKKMEEFYVFLSEKKNAVLDSFSRRQATIGVQRYTCPAVTRLSTLDLIHCVERINAAVDNDLQERRLLLKMVAFSDKKSLDRVIDCWERNNSNTQALLEEINYKTQPFLDEQKQELNSMT